MSAIVPPSVGEGDIGPGFVGSTPEVLGVVVWVGVASTEPYMRRKGELYLVGKVMERWDVTTLCVKDPSMRDNSGRSHRVWIVAPMNKLS